MSRKNRSPEENARREKTRELLQMTNIGSMDDIQNLFKETVAELMENDLEAKTTAAKLYAPALGMWRYRHPGIGSGNLSLKCKKGPA